MPKTNFEMMELEEVQITGKLTGAKKKRASRLAFL
jgi:hypothetical protein